MGLSVEGLYIKLLNCTFSFEKNTMNRFHPVREMSKCSL